MRKAEQLRVRALLSEAITVLCKNALKYRTKFSIEGLLGITLDDEEIFLVNLSEIISNDKDSDTSESESVSKQSNDHYDPLNQQDCVTENKMTGRARPRKQGAPQMLMNAIPRKPVKRLAPEPARTQVTKKMTRIANNPIVIKEEVDPDENIGMTAAEMNMLLWQQHSQQQAVAMAAAAAAALSSPSQIGSYNSLTPTLALGRSQKRSPLFTASTSKPALKTPTECAKRSPETANDVIEDSSDFFQIARTILKLEGSFISARVIRRRYQRFSTEMIVNTMKAMTKPQNDKLYVGEYHSLRKKIQVFYKSPPEKLTQEALDTYSIPLELYTNQYFRSARPAKGGPFDWAAYLSIVKDSAPFPLPEDCDAKATDSSMILQRHNAFFDYATPHLFHALAHQKNNLENSPMSMWNQADETFEEECDQNLQNSPTNDPDDSTNDPIDLAGDSFNSEGTEESSKLQVKQELSDEDSKDENCLQINEKEEIISSSTIEQLKALTHSISTEERNKPDKNYLSTSENHPESEKT